MFTHCGTLNLIINIFSMPEQKYRVESDLLGELQVPADAYYGVQDRKSVV